MISHPADCVWVGELFTGMVECAVAIGATDLVEEILSTGKAAGAVPVFFCRIEIVCICSRRFLLFRDRC